MSSVMRPRGPLPPSVYWRRRLIALAVLVVLIVIVSVIIASASQNGSKPSGGTGGGQTTGTNSSTTAATGACDPAKLTLTADTDKSEYAAGENPQLWFTLESKTATCTLQLTATSTTYVISSPSGTGSETYWTSADCKQTSTATAAPSTITLKAGTPQDSTTKFTWDRTHSKSGVCTGGTAIVLNGQASFDFTVKLGDLTATKRIYLN